MIEDHQGLLALWFCGSGKSAIAQNLAEKYTPRRVAASFFFSRNDSSRDKLEPFVASIAYQFCKPDSPLRTVLGPHIIEAIRSDPNIFHTSFERQFEKLIVEPCFKAEGVAWDDLPLVIEVDGLDECFHHPSQERLLAIICRVATFRTPVPWAFIVFSRPDVQIRDALVHGGFDAILKRFTIQPSEEVNKDIKTIFCRQIRRTSQNTS
ncbi:hypothetical protein MPER_11421 [Moniliophthora perniciosa FA553]|nr:hypothetical protein MPER_11421 [Moniliophthora perniciosa FA553]